MAGIAERATGSGDRGPLLVGRTRERGTLYGRLAAAQAGHGGLVLIGGEAGIGKTALAEALGREAAAEGAIVVAGRCYDRAATAPYGPWVELLARVPAGQALPSPPLAAATEQSASGGMASQAALFAAVREFLVAAAARHPLVLLLDDVHWADGPSLELLRFLARGLADLPLLLLVTYRADEVERDHPLYESLPFLVREGGAVRLDLKRLDDDAARALVRARYPLPPVDEARLVASLQARAAGNPFYLGELLRACEEAGILGRGGAGEQRGGWALGDLDGVPLPPLLRQVIDGRLARLGAGARDRLAIAAVIGQEPPLALWSEVADLDEEEALGLVERAQGARILEPAPDGIGLRFVHALIREALYDGILPPRRRAWHRRIAEAQAAGPSPDPDAVAYHFQTAGDPRAARWLIRAGDRAGRFCAFPAAAERFEAALALLGAGAAMARERGWTLFRLARVRRYEDPHAGMALLDEAERLGVEGGDLALVAHARYDRGFLRYGAGDARAGLAEMEAAAAALDALPEGERDRLRGLDGGGLSLDTAGRQGTLVTILALLGRFANAVELGRRVVAGATAEAIRAEIGGSSFADAHYGMGVAYMALGRPAEGRRSMALARDLYRAIGHWHMLGVCLWIELEWIVLFYHADLVEERRRLAEAAAGAFERVQAPGAGLPPQLVRLSLLLLEGHWDEAWQITQALQPLVHMRQDAGVRLALDRGDLALAQQRSREAVAQFLPEGPATEPGAHPFGGPSALIRLAAEVALAGEDLPGARAWLEAHDRWQGSYGAVLGRAEGLLLWAAYHRATGAAGEALRLAEAAEREAAQPRQPLALLAARRLLGELHTAACRHDAAAASLELALVLAEACAAPYERALTELARAALYAARGEHLAAEVALTEARAICQSLGAAPALARADALAARLAAPLSVSPEASPKTSLANRRAYPAGLSAREVEVLRLVADGLTNAQVAERLFLSPRTVNAHLTTIYGKLGVPSRGAAIRFALEHDLH